MEQIIVYLTNVFQEYLIIILLLCFSLIAFLKKLRCPKCKKFSLKKIPLEELHFLLCLFTLDFKESKWETTLMTLINVLVRLFILIKNNSRYSPIPSY